jgi:hypothetical protein
MHSSQTLTAQQNRNEQRATSSITWTPQQRQLIELMQRIRYGTIIRMQILHGQPDFNSRIEWKRTVKILGENRPHPRLGQSFVPKQEIIELFRLFETLGDGEIHNLEIRDGIPFLFEIKEVMNP